LEKNLFREKYANFIGSYEGKSPIKIQAKPLVNFLI